MQLTGKLLLAKKTKYIDCNRAKAFNTEKIGLSMRDQVVVILEI